MFQFHGFSILEFRVFKTLKHFQGFKSQYVQPKNSEMIPHVVFWEPSQAALLLVLLMPLMPWARWYNGDHTLKQAAKTGGLNVPRFFFVPRSPF